LRHQHPGNLRARDGLAVGHCRRPSGEHLPITGHGSRTTWPRSRHLRRVTIV
jgi:hypothetical protein